jgi:hypothetical protein
VNYKESGQGLPRVRKARKETGSEEGREGTEGARGNETREEGSTKGSCK